MTRSPEPPFLEPPTSRTTATVTVVDAGPGDRSRATAALVAAFVADPIVRWMFPLAEQYLIWFPHVVAHSAGKAFDHGTAHLTDDGAGAALWIPPGVTPDDEALGAVIASGVASDRLAEVFALFERAAGSHPETDHWYLPVVGVDVAHQGHGHGSSLLAHSLTEIDRHHQVAYLESSNPTNIAFYERFGFTVIDEVQVASSPPMWPMLRPAPGETPPPGTTPPPEPEGSGR